MKKNIVKLLVLAIAVMSVMLAFASCGCSHEEEEIPAVAATCTEAGSTAGTKCKLCGEVLVAPAPTEATGHDFKLVGKVEATCTTEGHEAGSRCDCGEIQFGCAVITTVHKPVAIAEKPATCTEDGVAAGIRCSLCLKDIDGFDVIEKLGHDLLTVAAAPASCTETGNTEGVKCQRCDYSDGIEFIQPTGHTEGDAARVEPTCTEDGHEAGKKCTTCNAIMEGCAPIEKLGHTLTNEVVTVAPGLGKTGLGTATCSVCNANLEITIPALKGGEWNYTSAEDCLVIGKNSNSIATQELVTEGDKTYVKITIKNPGLHPNSNQSGDKAVKNGELIFSWKPDQSVVQFDALTADNYFIFKTKLKIDSIVTKWTPVGTQFDNDKAGAVDQYYHDWLFYPSLSTNTDVNNSSDNFNVWANVMPVMPSPTTSNALDGWVFKNKEGEDTTLPLGEWVELTMTYHLNVEDPTKCEINIYLGETLIYHDMKTMKPDVPGKPIQDYRFKLKNTRVYDEFVICFDDTTFQQLPRETAAK